MTAHFSASMLARAFSFSTFLFSFPTISAKASASFFLTSASIYFSFTSISMTATFSSVSLNFTRPYSYLSIFVSKSLLFFCNIFVNRLISSKKDLGVVYAYLLSSWSKLSPKLLTKLKLKGMNLITESLITSSPSSTDSRNYFATPYKAS